MNRRNAIQTAIGSGIAISAAGTFADTDADDEKPGHIAAVGRRRIPSTGELLPMVGLGTSRTFDVDPATGLDPVLDVMEAFLNAGGTLVDSSPMYRRAEAVTGALLDRLGRHDLFFATKVWTDQGREVGIEQMNNSIRLMRAPTMDLMQIHNLVDWETHLRTLREWKAAGRIRYIGITEMNDFELTERILRAHDIDFVQIPYSIGDRRVEERILPAAIDTGTAVLVMRPFEQGRLFRQVKGQPLPAWAAEIGCASWAQLFLKFVLGHPAVTCPIPATAKVHHVVDNMGAGTGPMPDADILQRMVTAVVE